MYEGPLGRAVYCYTCEWLTLWWRRGLDAPRPDKSHWVRVWLHAYHNGFLDMLSIYSRSGGHGRKDGRKRQKLKPQNLSHISRIMSATDHGQGQIQDLFLKETQRRKTCQEWKTSQGLLCVWFWPLSTALIQGLHTFLRVNFKHCWALSRHLSKKFSDSHSLYNLNCHYAIINSLILVTISVYCHFVYFTDCSCSFCL